MTPPFALRAPRKPEDALSVSLSLPYPPSANRLWRAVKGRQIKSAEYRAWLVEAGWKIKAQHPGQTITGPYHMLIEATAPDRRRRDLSNLIKALEDAMVQVGVIADDSNCRRLTAFWANDTIKGGAIEVTLAEAA